MVGCENKLHLHDQMKPEKTLSLGKIPQEISVFLYVKSLKKLAVVYSGNRLQLPSFKYKAVRTHTKVKLPLANMLLRSNGSNSHYCITSLLLKNNSSSMS